MLRKDYTSSKFSITLWSNKAKFTLKQNCVTLNKIESCCKK